MKMLSLLIEQMTRANEV